MSIDEWFERYRPIQNPRGETGLIIDDKCYTFDCCGEDLAVVKETAERTPEKIWTVVAGEGELVLIDGLHFVNRVEYFITEVGHTGERLEIPYDD